MKTALGKLKEIESLRDVWPNEAQDFTPWLSKNLALLSAAVGFDITLEETESAVGDYRADILAAESESGRKIIIENQLAGTDHDHLGKLITYASGKSAEAVIWVVKHANEKHIAAIEWLNNHTDEEIGFFLCEIKLYQIDDSKPAVKFEVIEKPNNWAKAMRSVDNERKQQYYDFWDAFQEYVKGKPFTKEFHCRKPAFRNFMNFTIGCSACDVVVTQVPSQNKLRAALYIGDNMDLFFSLLEKKEAIEQESGLTFDWNEMPGNIASQIAVVKEVNFGDREQWNAQFEWLMDVMVKIKKVFKKYI